jgi:hypothetical protein
MDTLAHFFLFVDTAGELDFLFASGLLSSSSS